MADDVAGDVADVVVGDVARDVAGDVASDMFHSNTKLRVNKCRNNIVNTFVLHVYI